MANLKLKLIPKHLQVSQWDWRRKKILKKDKLIRAKVIKMINRITAILNLKEDSWFWDRRLHIQL